MPLTKFRLCFCVLGCGKLRAYRPPLPFLNQSGCWAAVCLPRSDESCQHLTSTITRNQV